MIPRVLALYRSGRKELRKLPGPCQQVWMDILLVWTNDKSLEARPGLRNLVADLYGEEFRGEAGDEMVGGSSGGAQRRPRWKARAGRVREALATLVAGGWLKIIERAAPGRAVVYRVCVPSQADQRCPQAGHRERIAMVPPESATVPPKTPTVPRPGAPNDIYATNKPPNGGGGHAVRTRLIEIGVRNATVEELAGSPLVTVERIDREWSVISTRPGVRDRVAFLVTRLRHPAGESPDERRRAAVARESEALLEEWARDNPALAAELAARNRTIEQRCSGRAAAAG